MDESPALARRGFDPAIGVTVAGRSTPGLGGAASNGIGPARQRIRDIVNFVNFTGFGSRPESG